MLIQKILIIKKLGHNSYRVVAILLQKCQVFLEVGKAHFHQAGKVVLDLLVESLETRRCHLFRINSSWGLLLLLFARSKFFGIILVYRISGLLVEKVCEGLGDAVIGREH